MVVPRSVRIARQARRMPGAIIARERARAHIAYKDELHRRELDFLDEKIKRLKIIQELEKSQKG